MKPDLTDQAEADRVAAKLANFGDNAGRHGPLAAVTIPMRLRMPRETALRLTNLARGVNAKPGALAVQVLAVVADCPPRDLYRALAIFQKAAGRRAEAWD